MTPLFLHDLAALHVDDLRAQAATARRARAAAPHRDRYLVPRALTAARRATGYWLVEAGLHLLARSGAARREGHRSAV